MSACKGVTGRQEPTLEVIQLASRFRTNVEEYHKNAYDQDLPEYQVVSFKTTNFDEGPIHHIKVDFGGDRYHVLNVFLPTNGEPVFQACCTEYTDN